MGDSDAFEALYYRYFVSLCNMPKKLQDEYVVEGDPGCICGSMEKARYFKY